MEVKDAEKKKALHNKVIKEIKNTIKSKKGDPKTEARVIKHKVNSSRRTNIFQCRSCDYKTSKTVSITGHLHKHDACSFNCAKHSAPYKCYHCPFTTDEEQIIATHLLSHGFKANKIADGVHATSEEMTNSPGIKNDTIYFCDTCNEEFREIHNLECHRKFSHRHELKICEHCKKRFTCFDALQNHIKIHKIPF